MLSVLNLGPPPHSKLKNCLSAPYQAYQYQRGGAPLVQHCKPTFLPSLSPVCPFFAPTLAPLGRGGAAVPLHPTAFSTAPQPDGEGERDLQCRYRTEGKTSRKEPIQYLD